MISWPYLGLKSGGIKRGELVVVGAYSKSTVGIRTIVNNKAVCMYQIQIRRYDSQEWTNYGRPWLTKQMALVHIDALDIVDAVSNQAGHYVYQIVEV
jgi:hypothetical protein